MSPLLSRGEKEDQEPEITLSTTSLLGLFLGLVLICGVFFGFGYSVGRHSAASAAINTTSSTEAADSGAQQSSGATPAATEDAPVEKLPAPSAPVTLPFVQTQGPTAPERPATPLPKAQPTPPSAPKQPAKATATATHAQPAPAGHTMVQVAAVVHQEDADVLLTALRRRGFGAVVRTEPQDKLLHVQVGPFGTRAEANATRQKLLADGYNAILKP